jgi:hypothetical protein
MKRLILISVLAAATLLGVGIASGEQQRQGDLRLSFDGRFVPQTLPRDRDVPVTVTLNGSIRTTEGVRPPQLRRMSVAVNRHGLLSTVGLPVCDPGRLEATSAKEALARCRGALVGRGRFGANVDFPGLLFPVEGRMLAFNSRAGGKPTIALHVYGASPVEVTVILIFRINHPRKGRFGTVLSTRIPKIAADLGYVTDISLTFGRTYRHRGKTRSFISARCAAPTGFPIALFTFAKGSFVFANGQKLEPSLVRNCRVR